MGFEAEYYSEAQEFRDMLKENRDNSTLGRKGYWRKKDKTLIKISDMTAKHILNCLDMIDTALVRYINKCMSQNIDTEIPDEYKEKVYELETELKVKTKEL